MKYLVLGSNSFSGASFCNFLLEKNIEVIAASRSDELPDIFLPYKWQDKKQLQFFKCDINKDLEVLSKILREEKPTHIVNYAAQSMVAQSWDNPKDWFQTNTIGLLSLLKCLTNYSGLEHYLHVTTPEVYGSTGVRIRENDNYKPTTPYAISRAAGDMLINSYAEQYSLPSSLTRAANVFGAGQQLYRIIPITIMKCLLGEKLTLDGGGKSKRSFIHINDVNRANLLISQNKANSETYHISNEQLISVRDCVSIIIQKLNLEFDDVVIEGPERPGKDDVYDLSSKKLQDHFSWIPEVAFEDGIEEVISWVKKNLENLKTMELGYVHKK